MIYVCVCVCVGVGGGYLLKKKILVVKLHYCQWEDLIPFVVHYTKKGRNNIIMDIELP